MNKAPGHTDLVAGQFGARAAKYLASPTHATGHDLERIAAIAAQCRPVAAIDLGCGGGHASYAVAAHATRVMATDLSADMLRVVAAEALRRGVPNIATACMAAESLTAADGAFDFLTCRYSVHHWRNPPNGLAEARRVLRAGATAVFVDVIAPRDAAADTHLQAVEVLRDPSHARNYRADEWRAMLGAAGFAVSAFEPGRLRMEFDAWVGRMDTPAVHRTAIRALQKLASREVADHFAIELGGSFTLDTVLIVAQAV